jgi:hypothetical protein
VAVSVAPNGLPWTADASGGISRLRPGGALGAGWSALPGAATDIAVSTGVAPTAWMIGKSEDVHAWNGGSWDLIPGRATRIAAGPDGAPWTVDAAGMIHQLVPEGVSRVAFTTSDGGRAKGRAAAASGSLFPGDAVEIDGSTDLSGVIVGKKGARVYSIRMDTSSAYYDFVIEVDGQGPKGLRSGTLDLRFVDENDTTYKLGLFLSDRRRHTVRYDSDLPGIKEIRWT